jgi:site-specific DNA recombinase
VTTQPRRAILYLRLSVATEDSTSIARQRKDLHEHANREGWEIVAELVDDGISGRKARANATEALRMLREREADVLAVWKLDRWTRQGLSAVGDLVRTLDEAPGTLFVALQDGLRSDLAAFGIIAAVLSETARAEADNAAMRVRSSIAHRRETGRFRGGTVPFGYRPAPHPDGGGRTLVLHAPEVAVIREVADRLLDGESQASILDDLTARSIATTRSPFRLAEIRGEDPTGLGRGSWSYAALAAVWTGENLLGRVSYSVRTTDPKTGEEVREWHVLRDKNGLPRTVFPPLLDFATVERLRANVRDAKHPTERRPPRPRRARLLSDVLFCGECGGKLWVTVSGGRTVYSCARRAGICSGPNMKAENAERAVEERFLAIAGGWPELEEIEEVSAPDTVAALADVEAAIREASAELIRDDVDGPAILRRINALKARRAELEATPSSISVRVVPTGRTIAEAFAAEDVDGRRRMLLRAIEHAELAPTETKGHTGYHPERITIRWRDADEDYDAA